MERLSERDKKVLERDKALRELKEIIERLKAQGKVLSDLGYALSDQPTNTLITTPGTVLPDIGSQPRKFPYGQLRNYFDLDKLREDLKNAYQRNKRIEELDHALRE